MEVAALQSSPFLQPSTPPAIRHNETLPRWPFGKLTLAGSS